MMSLRAFWQFVTRDDRELPDLNPIVVERSWTYGKEIVSRVDTGLMERVVKAKAKQVAA